MGRQSSKKTINSSEKEAKSNPGEVPQTESNSTQSKNTGPNVSEPTVNNNSNSNTSSHRPQLLQIRVPLTQANEVMDHHSAMIYHECNWLKTVINARIDSYFKKSHIRICDFTPPPINEKSHYGAFIHRQKLNPQQRIVLSITLAAEIYPDVFDTMQINSDMHKPYAEFGGMTNPNYSGFIPTIKTALFILAGADLQQHLEAKALFNVDAQLFTEEIIEFPTLIDNSLIIHTQLTLPSNCRDHILLGREVNPHYSNDFPAQSMSTHLEWADLILMEDTEKHLQELMLWLKHSKVLIEDWNACPPNTGYKVLLYGPPGTGKTLAATLLAKKLNQPIYRIDLSQIVSKFIGETEKNLEKIFRRAEQKDWILFFDEADSLFSKRSTVSNANDRHANQETAYLLQRIESCQNLVILASNLKDNIDEAFLRRFQSIIHFPKPEAEQREILWHNSFSAKADLSDIDISALAQKYDLSGAEINNVTRIASLKAIDRENARINQKDIIDAIRREKFKEGKFL